MLRPDMKFNVANAAVQIIDTMPVCQEVASNILSAYGFRKILRCADLAVAADVLRLNTIDLMLIDPMPFADQGYEFVRKLRADLQSPNTRVPVIMIAAYTHIKFVTAARECGADYIATKPFSTSSLLDRILWVASKESHRSELTAPTKVVSQEGSGMELW